MEQKNPSPDAPETSPKVTWSDRIDRIVYDRRFSYVFLVSVLIYLILAGYVMFFSGDLFIEAISKGWYKASASEYDSQSFMLGYLYGFASLMGVVGAIAVLASRPHSYFRHKVLLFVPSVVWSTILVLDIVRWGLGYWIQWLYHVPIMLLCMFVMVGVVKQVEIPYFGED